MEHVPATKTESQIRVDETFWAIRMGSLQTALYYGIEDWYSDNLEYAYRATAAIDPYEGLPAYDSRTDAVSTIPDPERLTSTGEAINPARWTICRTRTSDMLIQSVACKLFMINEKTRKIRVAECPDGFWEDTAVIREEPNFQDIAELCDSLDGLQAILSRYEDVL